MNKLENLRNTIDEIDSSMKELFIKRLNVLQDIIEYKKENNLPIFDEEREYFHKLDMVKDILCDNEQEYYLSFLSNVMNLSKKYELGSCVDTLDICGFKTIKKLDDVIQNKKSFYIIDRNVLSNKYVKNIVDSNNNVYLLDATEENKNLNIVFDIISVLNKCNINRDSFIVGIGGGITLDIAGFVSSIYLRGTNYISVPTTLLAMVDASIGGKCGVNLYNVKNQVGSFYYPTYTIIDLDFLETLDKKVYNCGIAEIIKMFICLDKESYNKFINDKMSLEDTINKVRSLKRHIVCLDEHDYSIRHVLNFGHTVGHIIETMTCGKISHGDAVSIGMVYEVNPLLKNELISVLKKYDLPFSVDFDIDFNIINHDKKIKDNLITYINLKDIGNFEIKKVTTLEFQNIVKGNISHE